MSGADAGGAGSAGRPAAPEVHTGLTDSHFRGFVRADEAWPEDSPQYRAGCGIENRKRPPPPEVPGDAFDRQRVIPGFDQGLIERQVCLVLGAGGIGQDVALALARLGVGKIVVVDRDTYDPSNLTRQCLGGRSDVGLRKVDVAARGLRECHSLRSEVVAVHCDVLSEWPRIVSLAREATVVFNGIDIGVMWDFCVNSLCKQLGLPLVCGQSFGWKFMAELYTGESDEVCAFCHDSTLSVFQANEQSLARKSGVLERLESFLDARGASAAQGAAASDAVDAEVLAAFLSQDDQFRCSEGQLLREVVQGALVLAGLPALRRASLLPDLLSFLQSFHGEVTARLLPGHISGLPNLSFIPRPRQIDTRYIGSWVCPCLGCAVVMISQWSAWLTSQQPEAEDGRRRARQNLPQTVTFNLDAGMTSEEQLGYELGSLGVSPDKGERRFCQDRRNQSCLVCSAAAAIEAEKSLFVGRLPVILAPVPGDVIGLPGGWHQPPPPEGDSEQRAAATACALARQRPLKDLGDEYANVVVPAMPALDWERMESGSSSHILPPELAVVPLLKVSAESPLASSPSALRGVASGVRSALVYARGSWWRLKGCGNSDEGFPVKAVGDRGELSVRGCCFRHTADTELRMSALAAEALAAAGLDAANRPAGSYRYAPGAGWPLPKIERHCAAFETLGNARLGDHLLAGLLRLLPHVAPAPPGYGFAALRGAVAAGRAADPAELWPTATAVSCGLPTADAAAQLAASGSALAEAAPPAAEALGPALPPELAGAWDAARAGLADRLAPALAASGEPSLLLWLAWRLGWECGATVRALHGAGIAWGTYPDSMGVHCNAHTNNFVVKPPDAGLATTFLAALDFDMAFTHGNFLPTDTGSHVSLGLGTWQGVLDFEANMGMKMVLSGSDFSNTGVDNSAEVPETHSAVEMAVRDTLVAAYEAALSGSPDAHPHHEDMRKAAYELVKLALCLTTHVQG